MKKNLSRSDWFHKDPNINEWLKKTAPIWARDDHSILIYLNALNENDFKRTKQRWYTHTYREKRKSISCDISPTAFSTLRKIQGKRGLVETLEELINLNYAAKQHYKHVFEEKLNTIKSKREIGISRELNKLSSTIENTAIHRSKLSELKDKVKEQEGQIEALRIIALTLSEKLLTAGISLDSATIEKLKTTLNPTSQGD